MEAILNYIGTMFAGIPANDDTRRLREEITANMTDRFNELVKAGKNESEAVGTVISEFGNIDEVLAEMGIERNTAKPEKNISPVKEFVHKNIFSLIARPLAALLLMFAFSYWFSINHLVSVRYIDVITVASLCISTALYYICFIIRKKARSKHNEISIDARAALTKHREKNSAVVRAFGFVAATVTAVLLIMTYFLEIGSTWQWGVRIVSSIASVYFVFECAMRNEREMLDIYMENKPETLTAVQCVFRYGLACLTIAVCTHYHNMEMYDGNEETLIFMLKFVPYVAAAFITALCAAYVIDCAVLRSKMKSEK